MNEPLFWNPLADAAAWLTQKTGRVMDARALVDTIAQMGRPGDPAPTIVKAMLPQGLNFAVVTIGATQPKSEAGKFEDDQLTKRYGPLPSCMSYLRAAFPTVAPLCVNHLLLLLMRGEVSLMFVDDPRLPNGAKIQLMPFGTEHTATLDTCGINRADLLALCDKLSQTTTAPEPVKPKAKRTTWQDISTPHILEVMRGGQYSTCKELFRALEAKAGPDSPFDKGTGDKRGALFVREIAQSVSLKTMQNEWQALRELARK
jgi:hypothetical protein